MAQSMVRQNYHQDCEAGVNKQINLELYASYVYLSMVMKNYCDTSLLCAQKNNFFKSLSC